MEEGDREGGEGQEKDYVVSGGGGWEECVGAGEVRRNGQAVFDRRRIGR